MRVPSAILSVLKHHAGEPAPGDETITVPAVALPILELPGALTETGPGVTSTAARNESFLAHFARTVTNAGGLTVNLTALRPGLWRLGLMVSVFNNYTPAVTVNILRIHLEMPRGNVGFPWLNVKMAGGIPINMYISEQFSFEREVAVNIIEGANGVGETYDYQVALYGARLL